MANDVQNQKREERRQADEAKNQEAFKKFNEATAKGGDAKAISHLRKSGTNVTQIKEGPYTRTYIGKVPDNIQQQLATGYKDSKGNLQNNYAVVNTPNPVKTQETQPIITSTADKTNDKFIETLAKAGDKKALDALNARTLNGEFQYQPTGPDRLVFKPKEPEAQPEPKKTIDSFVAPTSDPIESKSNIALDNYNQFFNPSSLKESQLNTNKFSQKPKQGGLIEEKASVPDIEKSLEQPTKQTKNTIEIQGPPKPLGPVQGPPKLQEQIGIEKPQYQDGYSQLVQGIEQHKPSHPVGEFFKGVTLTGFDIVSGFVNLPKSIASLAGQKDTAKNLPEVYQPRTAGESLVSLTIESGVKTATGKNPSIEQYGQNLNKGFESYQQAQSKKSNAQLAGEYSTTALSFLSPAIVTKIAKQAKVVIPTIEKSGGEVIYRGISIADKPIIGKSGSQILIGNPAKRPDALQIERINPQGRGFEVASDSGSTKLTSQVYTSPESLDYLKSKGVISSEDKRLIELGKTFEQTTRGSKPYKYREDIGAIPQDTLTKAENAASAEYIATQQSKLIKPLAPAKGSYAEIPQLSPNTKSTQGLVKVGDKDFDVGDTTKSIDYAKGESNVLNQVDPPTPPVEPPIPPVEPPPSRGTGPRHPSPDDVTGKKGLLETPHLDKRPELPEKAQLARPHLDEDFFSKRGGKSKVFDETIKTKREKEKTIGLTVPNNPNKVPSGIELPKPKFYAQGGKVYRTSDDEKITEFLNRDLADGGQVSTAKNVFGRKKDTGVVTLKGTSQNPSAKGLKLHTLRSQQENYLSSILDLQGPNTEASIKGGIGPATAREKDVFKLYRANETFVENLRREGKTEKALELEKANEEFKSIFEKRGFDFEAYYKGHRAESSIFQKSPSESIISKSNVSKYGSSGIVLESSAFAASYVGESALSVKDPSINNIKLKNFSGTSTKVTKSATSKLYVLPKSVTPYNSISKSVYASSIKSPVGLGDYGYKSSPKTSSPASPKITSPKIASPAIPKIASPKTSYAPYVYGSGSGSRGSSRSPSIIVPKSAAFRIPQAKPTTVAKGFNPIIIEPIKMFALPEKRKYPRKQGPTLTFKAGVYNALAPSYSIKEGRKGISFEF